MLGPCLPHKDHLSASVEVAPIGAANSPAVAVSGLHLHSHVFAEYEIKESLFGLASVGLARFGSVNLGQPDFDLLFVGG